jgi:hypothetical protein
MDHRNANQLRDELTRLMLEQIDSLKRATFVGLTQEEVEQEAERLKHIRELSADYLARLKSEE